MQKVTLPELERELASHQEIIKSFDDLFVYGVGNKILPFTPALVETQTRNGRVVRVLKDEIPDVTQQIYFYSLKLRSFSEIFINFNEDL